MKFHVYFKERLYLCIIAVVSLLLVSRLEMLAELQRKKILHDMQNL